MNPFDTQELHPAECRGCYGVFRDGDVLDNGLCPTCVLEQMEEDDDGGY